MRFDINRFALAKIIVAIFQFTQRFRLPQNLSRHHLFCLLVCEILHLFFFSDRRQDSSFRGSDCAVLTSARFYGSM